MIQAHTNSGESHTERAGVELTGIDGANPLGFLAALGAVRCLAAADPDAGWAMRWDEGTLHPTLVAQCPDGASIASIDAVAAQCAGVLRWLFAGGFSFERYPATSPGLSAADYDAVARAALGACEAPLDALLLELISAVGCGPTAQNEMAGLTALSFANGQSGMHLLGGAKATKSGKMQQYGGLRDIIPRPDLPALLADALSTWTYVEGFRSFRWCPTEFRPAALQGEGAAVASVPGANALAFVGLSFFPTVPTASGVRTVGLAEHDDGGRWLLIPIWSGPLGVDAIRGLIAQTPALASRSRTERRAVGLHHILQSHRFTFEKGVYFAPATGA